MISCKRATELISKSMEETLSLGEELALKFHMFICEFCEQYKNQLQIVRKLLGQEAEQKGPDSCPPLSASAKEAMKEKIRNSQ